MSSAAPPANPFKNAIRDFNDALETAGDVLTAKVADSVFNIDAGDVLDEDGDNVIRVDRQALADLLDRLEEASRAVIDAHKDFNWEVGRAFRNLKRALADAPAASSTFEKGHTRALATE
jgi:hypothetical protein